MTHKKIGRPDSIAQAVRAAIEAKGAAGASYPEIRAACPGVKQDQIKHCIQNIIRDEWIYRLGRLKAPRFFWRSVPMSVAEQVSSAELDAWGVRMDAQKRKWEREAQERMKAKRRAEGLSEKRRAELAAERERRAQYAAERRLIREQAAAAAKVGKNKAARIAMQAKTTRINKLADKYRGTASPKEPAKRGPQVVGMDSAPRTVCQPCRGRYDPEPGFVGSLSNLPFGVYAEPAGFVARAFLEAA